MKPQRLRQSRQLVASLVFRQLYWLSDACLSGVSKVRRIVLSGASQAALGKKFHSNCTTNLFKRSLLFCPIVLIACANTGQGNNSTFNYANPPAVDVWLPSQRELVVCETIVAARYMADFGFFHPQCTQLVDIGPRDYQVKSRQLVQLREGPMWLLVVEHGKQLYFMPLPWHDWL